MNYFKIYRHATLGIGIQDLSKPNNSEYLNIYFPSVSRQVTLVRNFSENMIADDATIYEILNSGMLKSCFDSWTKRKASALYDTPRIIKESDTELITAIQGSGYKEYEVCLDYNQSKGLLKLDCSCPVDGLCKHMYAVIDHFKSNISYEKLTPKDNGLLSPQEIAKYPLLGNLSYIDFKAQVKKLVSDKEYLNDVLNFIYQKDNGNIENFKTNLNYLVPAFSFSIVKDLLEKLIRSSDDSYKEMLTKIDAYFLETLKNYESIEPKFSNLLITSTITFKKLDLLLSYIKRTSLSNKEIVEIIVDYIRANSLSFESALKILITLKSTYDDFTLLDAIYTEVGSYKYSDILMFGYYSSLSKTRTLLTVDEIKSLYETFNNAVDLLPYLAKISIFKENEAPIVSRLLFKAMRESYETVKKKTFISTLNNLPNSTILQLIIEVNELRTSKRKYFDYLYKTNSKSYYTNFFDEFNEDKNVPLELKKKFDKALIESEDYNFTGLTTYFDLETEFSKEEDEPILTTRIKFKGAQESLFEFTFSRKGVYINTLLANPDFCFELFVYALHLPEFENNLQTVNNFIEEYDAYLLKIDEQEFNVKLKELLKNIARNSIIESGMKANLYPCLYYNSQEGIYNIYFKIGRSKKYKVKSIRELLQRIHDKETFKYGKDLILVHEPESFSDEALTIINIITAKEYIPSKFYRNAYEDNSDTISQILSNVNELDVEINDSLYHYSSTPLDVKFNVSDNYGIKPIYPKQYKQFIDGYLINDKIHEIRPFSNNKNVQQLFRLISEHPQGKIKENLIDFNHSFINKNKDIFELSEAVKKEISKNQTDIKIYFDYRNSSIFVSLKVFYGDQQIKLTEITSLYDIENLTSLVKTLEGFGFEGKELKGHDNIYNFMFGSLQAIKDYGEVYFSENLKVKADKIKLPQIIIRQGSTLLDVLLENSEYSNEELYKIYEAIKHKQKFVKLNDEFINLNTDEAKEFARELDNFELVGDKKILEESHVPTYYAFKALKNNDVKVDDYIEKVFDELRNFSDNLVKIPEINGVLRPYQEEGVRWLDVLYHNQLGGILADDMGLGKTIETIAFMKLEKMKKPNLIVCPKSLIFNWQSEFNRFAPEIKVVPIVGLAESRKAIINSINPKEFAVYIISYDSLRNEIENLCNIEFNITILDEAQFIKNVFAKKTQAVKNLTSLHSYALTGTPIENTIIDLWSIFDFLMPNYLKTFNEFKRDSEDESSLDITRQLTTPFILRRRKQDVLKDLPEKYEVLYTAEMTTEQRKIYDAYRLKAQEVSDNADGKAIFEVLSFITRLRQICVDPSLFIEDYKGDSGKIIALKEILEQKLAEGHRVLIFSQFVTALNKVSSLLKEMKVTFNTITGDTPAKTRLEIANDFNSKEETKVLLISLKAGGTGLNLIGADTVIHLDPWWNIAAENQAGDRAHRIGQTKTVEIIKLIIDDSIEKRVIELQNTKKDLVDKMIADDASGIKNLSISDLKLLLKS